MGPYSRAVLVSAEIAADAISRSLAAGLNSRKPPLEQFPGPCTEADVFFRDESIRLICGNAWWPLAANRGPDLPSSRPIPCFRRLCGQALASPAHDGFARGLACVRRSRAASEPSRSNAVARLPGPAPRRDAGRDAGGSGGNRRAGSESPGGESWKASAGAAKKASTPPNATPSGSWDCAARLWRPCKRKIGRASCSWTKCALSIWVQHHPDPLSALRPRPAGPARGPSRAVARRPEWDPHRRPSPGWVGALLYVNGAVDGVVFPAYLDQVGPYAAAGRRGGAR